MDPAFVIAAAVTLASAVAAVSLRQLIHCALCLAVSFTGLAAVYLQLSAEFVGFAQILVYVGAVAILIVFAVLLTPSRATQEPAAAPCSRPVGLAVALLVTGVLAFSVLNSALVYSPVTAKPTVTVHLIGDRLMTDYVLPLEVIGLLLTAALIGGVHLALKEGRGPQ